MPDNLPRITERAIQNWVGEPSFSRGRRYFRNGAIFDARREGMTLKALCQGSAAAPYRVRVTLSSSGVADAECSCPVGAGGHCKHVAALLLTWLHHPEYFREAPPLAQRLRDLDKDALIKLIQRMIDHNPELETAVEVWIPAMTGQGTIDAESLRRRVHRIIDHIPYEWGASYAAAAELREVVKEGEMLEDAGRWWEAAQFYGVIAEELMESYGNIYEEEGEFIEVLSTCGERLGLCLAELRDPGQREVVIRRLYEMVAWDIDQGGYGADEWAHFALVEDTTPEERAMVAEWVQKALEEEKRKGTETEGFSRQWRLQAYGGLMIDLLKDVLDDEAYLRLCRESGRQKDVVVRLVQMGRVDEARREAASLSDYELLMVAQQIDKEPRRRKLARELLSMRADSTNDTRILGQLLAWAREDGDADALFRLAQRRFEMRPDLASYQAWREIGRQRGDWETVRAEILRSLEQQGAWRLLVEILLDEKAYDDAIAAFGSWRQSVSWGGHHFMVRVADALAEARPQAAMEIYAEAVEQLVAQRKRPSYAEAAQLLKRIRDILIRQGNARIWDDLIASFRQQYKRLPALQDELNRAGL